MLYRNSTAEWIDILFLGGVGIALGFGICFFFFT